MLGDPSAVLVNPRVLADPVALDDSGVNSGVLSTSSQQLNRQCVTVFL